MIVYNNRYRGPMEYDKFILNTLQYANEINVFLYNEFYNSEQQVSFSEKCKQVTEQYNKILERENNLFLELLNFREV